jgi:hypothetical protein
MNGEYDMGKFIKINWIVSLLCLLGIVLALVFVHDWAQKLLVIFTIALFFVATQQSISAYHSALAAQISAQSAAANQQQAIYVHLASLWYQIK